MFPHLECKNYYFKLEIMNKVALIMHFVQPRCISYYVILDKYNSITLVRGIYIYDKSFNSLRTSENCVVRHFFNVWKFFSHASPNVNLPFLVKEINGISMVEKFVANFL